MPGRASTLDANRLNREMYRRNASFLQSELEAIHQDHGLGAALSSLIAQQRDAGFLDDPLADVLRYRVVNPNRKSLPFIVQWNDRRGRRLQGSGRGSPPAGWQSVHGGCFLCHENVAWQQRTLEMGYTFPLAGTAHTAWPNPFAFLPNHLTVAASGHVPQCWTSGAGSEQLIVEMLDLAGQLPGWIVMYNGEGAGASNPRHRHFQTFTRWAEREQFPLEIAAALSSVAPGASRVAGYPICVFALRDEVAGCVRTAVQLIDAWVDISGSTASANFAAVRIGETPPRFDLYFTPRTKIPTRSPGMSGMVGGLEVLGELVLSTTEERQFLVNGSIDIRYVESVLAAAEPPGVDELERRASEK